MVTRKHIEELSARIAAEFNPRKIVLFGSYAKGTPTEDSDVDLLVIMPVEGSEAQQSAVILRRIDPRIPLDLLVRTPESVERRLAWNDFFLREILETGTVMYESADV